MSNIYPAIKMEYSSQKGKEEKETNYWKTVFPRRVRECKLIIKLVDASAAGRTRITL